MEKHYENQRTLPEHSHEHAYFACITHGNYTESVNGRKSDLPRGSVVLHPVGERHENRFTSSSVTVLNVKIPDRIARRCAPCRVVSVAHPVIQSIVRRLTSELHRSDDLTPMIIEGLILELHGLMVRDARPKPGSSSLARRAEELIRRRFTEAITLSPIAEELDTDPIHLARVFRREIGCTIGERIRQFRIMHACDIIMRGAPLADVALQAGFADQSHLTRAFRATLGLTPGEYRRRLSADSFKRRVSF